MEIVPTTSQHIIDIEENVTLEDLQEFIMYKRYVAKNETPTLFEHLIETCSYYEVYTMVHEGEVMALGGELNGCVWFLTSNLLGQQSKEIKKEFIKVMNQHKERVLDETGYIWNFIWEGNLTHIAFLKLMGAEFPENVEDVPEQFKFFIMRR